MGLGALLLVAAAVVAQEAPAAKLRSDARALINAGRSREAAALIEKAKDPGGDITPELTQLLGVAYYHADDYARAIELLTPVADRLAPDSIERREAVQVLGLSFYRTPARGDPGVGAEQSGARVRPRAGVHPGERARKGA
jgi:hypothetical protein